MIAGDRDGHGCCRTQYGRTGLGDRCGRVTIRPSYAARATRPPSGRRDSNSVRATRQHPAHSAEFCCMQVFPGNRHGLARLPWKQLGSGPALIQTFNGGSEHLRIRAVPSLHGRHLDAAQFSLVPAVGKLGSCES